MCAELYSEYLNNKVCIMTDKGLFVGMLHFIGENKILGWKLSITVNRTPAHIQKIISIEHFQEKDLIINTKKILPLNGASTRGDFKNP